MSDLNSVNLCARLTRDPEMRAEGVCALRVAFSSRAKQGDEWGEKSNYCDVTAFGRLADLANEHLAKGRQVNIAGRLDYREWEDKEGNKRNALSVIASELQFIGPKSDAAAPAAQSGDEGSDDEPFFQ